MCHSFRTSACCISYQNIPKATLGTLNYPLLLIYFFSLRQLLSLRQQKASNLRSIIITYEYVYLHHFPSFLKCIMYLIYKHQWISEQNRIISFVAGIFTKLFVGSPPVCTVYIINIAVSLNYLVWVLCFDSSVLKLKGRIYFLFNHGGH